MNLQLLDRYKTLNSEEVSFVKNIKWSVEFLLQISPTRYIFSLWWRVK